jgi:hypothetical protein
MENDDLMVKDSDRTLCWDCTDDPVDYMDPTDQEREQAKSCGGIFCDECGVDLLATEKAEIQGWERFGLSEKQRRSKIEEKKQWLEWGITFNSDSRSADGDKDLLEIGAGENPICDGDVNLIIGSPFSKKATLRAIGKIKEWIEAEWVENEEETFIPIRCTHIDGGVSGPDLA